MKTPRRPLGGRGMLLLAGLLTACAHGLPEVESVSWPEAERVVTHAERGLQNGQYCLRAHGPGEDHAVMRAHGESLPHEGEGRALRDDVRAVLRADRIDLFGPAIEYLDSLPDRGDDASFRRRALSTQMRLSWAEAELIVAEVLLVASRQIQAEIGRIAAERAIGAERVRRQERVHEVREALQQARHIAASFRLVGQRRLDAARVLVEDIAGDGPEHYLTYRLRADVYRIDRDWPRFDRTLRGLERRRADGTGLKFLRGAAAVRRRQPGGLGHLEAALDDEAEFARAQVFRVLAMETIDDVDRELSALQRISPHHQLVEWIAPLLRHGALLDE